MDKDVVMHQMTERFRELFAKALDAVEQAPDGQWIAASEGVFLEVGQQLVKEGLQAALQARIEAHPTAKAATFSPCEPGEDAWAISAAQGRLDGAGVECRR